MHGNDRHGVLVFSETQTFSSTTSSFPLWSRSISWKICCSVSSVAGVTLWDTPSFTSSTSTSSREARLSGLDPHEEKAIGYPMAHSPFRTYVLLFNKGNNKNKNGLLSFQEAMKSLPRFNSRIPRQCQQHELLQSLWIITFFVMSCEFILSNTIRCMKDRKSVV